MKHKVGFGTALFVLMICCIFSSQEYQQRGEAKVAVSIMKSTGKTTKITAKTKASAKNAVFKNSKTTVKTKRLENDFIRVWRRGRGFFEKVFMQENLDGTDQQQIPIPNIYNALWLTNDWFYYSILNSKDIEVFYRAPISYKGGHATIDTTKKKERLFQKGEGLEPRDFMVTDSFILYRPGKEYGKSKYYWYDFATKKSKKIPQLSDDILCDEDTALPILQGNRFFVGDMFIGPIYRVSLDKLKMHKFYKGEMESVKKRGNNLYFLSDKNKKDGLWKYSGKNGKYTCLVDSKKIEKMDLWPAEALKRNLEMVNIGICGDKIYLHVYINYEVKELAEGGSQEGKMVDCYHGNPVLLSAELSNPRSWQLEKSLMDYLQGINQQKWVKDKKETVYYCKQENAWIDAIDGGEVIISYWDGTGGFLENNRVMVYDIATEEVQDLTDTDYRFWQATRPPGLDY